MLHNSLWHAALRFAAIRGDRWGFFIIPLYFVKNRGVIPLYFIIFVVIIPLYFVKNRGAIPLYFIKKLYLCT